MKLECIKEKLIKAISKAEKITGKNLTLPVLSCLLLKTDKNILRIIATNLDLGIEINIPAKVESGGTVAVPGNILSSLINNNLKDDKIFIEDKNENLIISTKNNLTVIKSQKSDDFPSIPKINKEKFFHINAKKLIKGLKSVWYSSSTSNIKPELSSVLIYSDSDNIVFVATDSFRLAEIKISVDKAPDFGQILIPFKNIPEIIRVFEDVEDDLKVYLTQNQIAFEYENIYLTSRIIDGVFPDYKQLIPDEFKTEIIVLKDDFLNSLKMSNIFSDKFNKINFNVKIKEKAFEIFSQNSDVGEHKNLLEGVLKGDDININFNQRYLMDCFQSIDSDSMVLKLNGTNKPLVIKSVPDSNFTYLVMPMNK